MHRVAVFGALIAVYLGLAGCVPAGEDEPRLASAAVPAAAAVPVPTAGQTPLYFTTTDRQNLPLRRWLPEGQVRAVILALHGFNDYSNAFDAPASLWAQRGIATYAYDQRGFGGAPGRRFWPGNAALATDAVAATQMLRAMYPGRPVYLLGESMGGAVAILAASGVTGIRPAAVDGVILCAPAVWTRDSMQFLPKLALWTGVRMFPGWTLTGQSLDIMPSDNIPMLRALSRDPMVIKGARVDTLYGLVDLMDETLVAAPRLDVPVLLQYGAHDAIVPMASIREFVQRLPADPGRRQHLAVYQSGYHMLLRDLDGPAVAADVTAWIFDRNAALPSGADAVTGQRPWPPSGYAGG